MDCPSVSTSLFDDDFEAEFEFQLDFGASFGFGADGGAAFGNFADLFEGSDASVELDNVSYDFMDDRAVLRRDERRRWGSGRQRRRRNRLFRIESVKTSMWYKRYTEEGRTQDLTQEALVF
jgi:hypothetical protein